MIKVHKFVVNPFQENAYLLWDETGSCVLVDMGSYTVDEKKEVLFFIENNQLEPVMIINTHCHVDHLLGNSFFKNKLKVPVAAHADDEFLIKTAVEHGSVFGFEVEEPPPVDSYLEEGRAITFGSSSLEVFHVPGHSPGSVALYSSEDAFVITGDVLFSGGIGRTDLPGGDYDTLIRSIKEKLMVLPDEVTVYPGHGPETTIGGERHSNPFLTG